VPVAAAGGDEQHRLARQRVLADEVEEVLEQPGVRTAEYRRRRDQQVRRLGRAYRRLGALVELLALDGGSEAGGERVNLDDLGRDVRVRGEAAKRGFPRSESTLRLVELEPEAAVLPPGDGGVGAEVGLAQDR
jgi:hypothetical protein